MSEGTRLVPKLRFCEFREAEGWHWMELAKLASVVMGSSPKSEFYNSDQIGLPLLQGNADIKNRLSAPRIFTSKVTKECRYGDILMSVRAPVGSVAKSIHIACIGRGIAAIRAEHQNNQEFLYQWLLFFEPDWETISQGGTFDAVNSEDLRKTFLSVPCVDEQQKIADCLSSVDELIAAQSRKVDALETHKQRLMKQLFPREGETQPSLRFPEFQNDGDWEERKAGSLFTNRTTKGENGLPIYSVTMTDGMVRRDSLDRKFDNIEDAAGNKRVFRNDIAYNMMRMWQGAMGVAPEDCLVSPAYVVLAPKKDAVPQFFQYMFKLPAMLLVLTSHSRGLTKDRLRLYFDDFARIAFRCPTAKEQQCIGCFLTSLDECITTQSEKLEALQAHKTGLMQQLFPSAEAAVA